MRKYIFAILLLSISATAFAVDCSTNDKSTCIATAGCGWDDAMGCKICEAGYYSTSRMDECRECESPRPLGWNDKSIFASNEFHENPTSSVCYWDVTCAANREFNTGKNNCQDNDCTCKPCGEHYEFKGEASIARFAPPNWLGMLVGGGKCEGKVYTVTLQSNFLDTPNLPNVYVKYDTGFSATPNGTFSASSWHTDSSPLINTRPTSDCGTFTGFYLGDTQYVAANGFLMGSINPTSFKGNTTLTGKWTGKEYTVQYICSPSNWKTSVCRFGEECKLAAVTSMCLQDGQIFKEWKCHKDSYCAGQTYSDGATLQSTNTCPTDANNFTVTLEAVWEDCPANSYCDGEGKHECPLGSKSDADSSKISDCYYDNTTKFKDDYNNGFNIQNLPKINHI